MRSFFMHRNPSAAVALKWNKSVMAAARNTMRIVERMFFVCCLSLCRSSAGSDCDAIMGKKASLVCVDNDCDKPLATFQINNRRYLGNKYKLLSEIRRIVKERCLGAHTFLDIFAGTGSVASAFPEMRILTNDILYSNYITHIAWFSGESYSAEKIAGILSAYNAASVVKDNYMSENFSDTYFSRADCRKIGYVREDIENRSKK